MPLYTVTLSRSVQEFATAEINAESAREAGIKAQAAENGLDWETDYTTYGPVFVDGMEELEDPRLSAAAPRLYAALARIVSGDNGEDAYAAAVAALAEGRGETP